MKRKYLAALLAIPLLAAPTVAIAADDDGDLLNKALKEFCKNNPGHWVCGGN